MNPILAAVDWLGLIGGLAIFLFGMNIMGEGLEKQSGGSLSRILGNMTDNPVKGLLLGIAVTAVIQSSSATSVMVVGFVNSGIMAFEQSIGIIMGANIGTTVTVWLLSLAGIEGGAWYINMFKPSVFSPVLALIGIILYMGKNQKKRDVGYLLVAFAILMTGMQMMSGSVTALKDVPEFQQLFIIFKNNPVLGVLVGAGVTAAIQASAASIGILQALSTTGLIQFGAAIPIIMGQNIGTCITAILSSIGANKAAKRVSVVHLCFNVIGTVIFLSIFYAINYFFPWPFMDAPVTETYIAVVHTVFNVVVTAILFPARKLLVKLAYLLVPEKKTADEKESSELLDERFLATPSVAVDRCREASLDMARSVQEAVELSLSLFKKYDESVAQKVMEHENITDKYEDKLSTYLLKLSERSLTQYDSKQVSLILHAIGDLERIGDHCVNLLDSAKELNTKGISFSKEACRDIDVIQGALSEALYITVTAFEHQDYKAVRKIGALEEIIDILRYELKDRHIKRLKQGNCSVETGFVFSDMLTSLERISDHCANIAVAMYELSENSMERHGFKSEVGDENFMSELEKYKMKYQLAE